MPKIILTRRREFLYWMQRFAVSIDGREVGRIKNGQSEEYHLPEGVHEIQCRMSWYKSNVYRVNLTGNDIQFLSARTNMKFWGVFNLILLSFLVLPIVFPNHRATIAPYTWVPLGAVFLYGAYNIIFRKNRSLKIEKDEKNIFSS